MSSLLSSWSIDNKSAHSNDKASRHAVGCASSASNASSSHQLLRHQKDALLTAKPIWSPSGNILLLNALERLSKRKIATNNYIDPYPTTTSTRTSTSTTTTTVLVCDLVTSVCVLQTANACREAGYTTHLIEDACADRDRSRHDQAVSYFAEDRTWSSHPIWYNIQYVHTSIYPSIHPSIHTHYYYYCLLDSIPSISIL